MQFPTAEFAVFFLIVYSLYWIASPKPTLRKLVLLGASYFFYGVIEWSFLGLLIGVSALNYFASLWIKGNWHDPRAKKRILILSVVLNLLILGFFKYSLFLTSNLNSLFLTWGGEAWIPILDIALPVGISFFTFQGMSYTIDVYRGDVGADRNALDVFLFIAFFPQLVAGPIVRGKEFIPQVKAKKAPPPKDIGRAALLIIGGLFKKVIVANYIAEGLVNPVFQDPSSFGSGDLLLGAYGFAIQIFCDFSAYSDIAIGIALLFGFEFPENFRKPFRASSLQDFWRRWHISLSTWLRDYLYIPFGGSRGSEAQTYRNLLITMFLGGLWHGASWTFVIWGLMHGVGLAVERWFSKGKTPEVELASGQPVVGEEGKRTGARPNKIMAQIKKIFAVLGTFHFVLLTWIVFSGQQLPSAEPLPPGPLHPLPGPDSDHPLFSPAPDIRFSYALGDPISPISGFPKSPKGSKPDTSFCLPYPAF
jgi:alginate O-acetyltransferase complex protein AlgI